MTKTTREMGAETIKTMTAPTEGFKLSEEDLKLRGPRDVLGKKQSGLPEFKVADIIHDYGALETARVDAVEIVENNLLENNPEFKVLAEIVEADEILENKLD